MSEQSPLVTVKILDRSYRIKCEHEEAPQLRRAAAYVDSQMRKLRHSGRVNSSESLAVVVALNTANELISSQVQQAQHKAQLEEGIMKLTQAIDQTLAKQEPVEV